MIWWLLYVLCGYIATAGLMLLLFLPWVVICTLRWPDHFTWRWFEEVRTQ